MLSICIPTYAYDITLLVQILHKQALQATIDFEICVIDDASPTYFQQKNQEIITLSSVSYQILPQNIGRSAIRNLLASQAKYPYLLFMDCDSMPETDNYIANYLTVINQAKIICGGRTYSPTSPHDDQYLRWKYGVARECKPAEIRNKTPNHSFMTNNFLIQKKLLLSIPFNTNLSGYGHEDTLLGYELHKQQITILHINNPLRHIGLESASIFLEKTHQGVENLALITEKLNFAPDFVEMVRLLKVYQRLKKYRLTPIIAIFYPLFHSILLKNLKSSTPNLRFFDLYKLGILIKTLN